MSTDTADRWYATGRRKSSVARVWMTPGTGQIIINKRDIDDYFTRPVARLVLRQPLELTENTEKFDFRVNVNGGGIMGQAGAIRHGISRALIKMDIELRPELKKGLFLRRDARCKERKKYGKKGARASYQFSKR